MKAFAVILATLVITGCSSVFQDPNTVGYRDYDPCIRCGEGWIFLPNPSHQQQLAEWKQKHGF